MVVRQQNSQTGVTQIVVTGNKSMSWRANVVLAASLGAVSVIFGGGIALFGFWLILPFAGLEFLLVLYCLGVVYRKLGFTEVISLNQDSVVVESGYQRPDNRLELPRRWATIEFDNPSSLFEVGTLVIRAGSKTLEVGHLLNKEEKRQLHRELHSGLRADASTLALLS
ncbi:hypothetical protein AB833_30035 [Chromatiales bacterium (ex Bugula neritina AB1)]|nr:hypothetical protein AB833_30035 [Chromatiales bacterium (ex Bugula neritina AB1)]